MDNKYLSEKFKKLQDMLSGEALDILNLIHGNHEIQTILKEEYFGRVTWSMEDLKNSLEEQGYDPSEKNVNYLLNTRLERTLQDQCISTGWDVINDVINMEGDNLEPLKPRYYYNGRKVSYWYDNQKETIKFIRELKTSTIYRSANFYFWIETQREFGWR